MTDDIKLAALRKWYGETGGKPCLMGCDGHVSNSGQEAVCAEARAANWFLACPPAHCTADGTAQLDLKDGFIMRTKKNFRRLIVKQVAATYSRSVPEGERGRLKVAVVLRILQMAAAQAHDPEKNIRDNKKVGYVEGENGLEYRPFEVLNSSFFQTAAAFGDGVADEGHAKRTVRQELAEANVEAARKQIMAVAGVLPEFEKPPVVDTVAEVPRHKARSRTQYGAIISDEDYERVLREEREAKEQAMKEKVSMASIKAREFAKKWAPLIREAKQAFEESKARGVLPGHTGLTPLRVGQLKALIVAHTGKGPKAQNNKEDAMKAEAAACINSPIVICTPPPSPPRGRAPWGLDVGVDNEDDDLGLGFTEDDEIGDNSFF